MPADRAPTEPAAVIGLVPVAEQSLILVPLLMLAVMHPVRVRELAGLDWLVAGWAAGTSFQVIQALTVGSGLAGAVDRPGATFVGRPALTALITASIGLAVAVLRAGVARPSERRAWIGALIRRGLAGLLPVSAWWLAVSAQAGVNAAVTGIGASGTDGADLPALLRAGWVAGGHGRALGWVLLVVAVLLLLIDGSRLRNAAEVADDPLPVPVAPKRVADRWAGTLTRWAGTRDSFATASGVWLVAAFCSVVAHSARDLTVVLVAHSRGPRPGEGARRDGARRKPGHESRWSAIARGRAAGVMIRTVRAEAIAVAAGAHTPARRRSTRWTAMAGLAGVLVTTLWIGPAWCDQLGAQAGSVGPAQGWPGVESLVGPWWQGLATWQNALIVIGVVSLVLLCASPLDHRGSVWTAPRAPVGSGLRDRSRSYLAASGPVEAGVDLVAAGLVAISDVAPGPFSRSQTRREVRRAVTDFVAAPESFIPYRRAAVGASSGPPTQPIPISSRPRTSPELPAVKLADGRLLSPLSVADERLFVAALDELVRDSSRTVMTPDSLTGTAAQRYRARIYGDEERLISLRPEKWSAGQNAAYGMVADVVHFDGRGSCWYVPDTLPESVRHRANLELDRRLIEFAAVVYYPASPFRALEVTTNNPAVARAFEERMARLAIPGHVVLEV